MTDQFIESAFKDVMAQLRAMRGPVASVWEYKFLVLPLSATSGVEESQDWLNTEGADGWEVAAVIPKIKQPSLDCLALMKRPRASTLDAGTFERLVKDLMSDRASMGKPITEEDARKRLRALLSRP